MATTVSKYVNTDAIRANMVSKTARGLSKMAYIAIWFSNIAIW